MSSGSKKELCFGSVQHIHGTCWTPTSTTRFVMLSSHRDQKHTLCLVSPWPHVLQGLAPCSCACLIP